MADSGFLGQGTAPGITTVDDMINMFFQSIFGAVGPSIRQFTDPMLGISGPGYRSAFLDSVVYSNITPYGVARQQQNAHINRMANAMLGNANKAAQLDWMRGMTETLTSFDTWRSRAGNENGTREQYQAWVDNEAMDKADNFIWSTGYKMLDPQGFSAASQYLSQAAGNISRRAINQGRRGAFIYGRAAANIFTDDKGGYEFESKDYGYMTIGEASGVAAALTKDLDLFKNTGFDRAAIQRVTQELRRTVQEYTQALAPLKDVFGSDIPAMIQAVEQLSGKRLAQISADRLGPMVERIMAGATVGGYNMQQLVGMNQQLTAAMGQMGLPYINTMGSLAQAETVLAAINSGYAPAAMRIEQFAQQANNWTLRTSNSAGADAINRAWAISGMSFEDFQAQLSQLERQGYSTTRALETITGKNMAGINYYGGMSERLLTAVEADFGGQVAREHDLDRMIANGRFSAYGSERGLYDQAVALVRDDIRYLNDTAFRQNEVKEGRLDAGVAQMMVGIQNGLFGPNLASALTVSYNDRQHRIQRDRQIKIMRAVNATSKYFLSNDAKSAINTFITNPDAGWNAFFQGPNALKIEDQYEREYLRAALDEASQETRILGLTGDAAAEYVQNAMEFEVGEGQTNALYTQAQLDYKNAKDPKTRARLARDMIMYRNVHEDRVSAYLNDPEKGKEYKKLARSVFRKAGGFSGNRKQAIAAGVEVEEALRVEGLSDFLGGAGIKDTELLDKFLTSARALAAKEGESATTSDLKKLLSDDAYKGFSETDRNLILRGIRDVGATESNGGLQLIGMIESLIQAIQDLVGAIDPEKVREGHKGSTDSGVISVGEQDQTGVKQG